MATASPVIQLIPHPKQVHHTAMSIWTELFNTYNRHMKRKIYLLSEKPNPPKIQMCETSRQNSKLKWQGTKRSFEESGREWETHPLRKRWLLKRSGQVLESVSYNCVLLCESETVSTTMAHKLRNCTNLILLSVFSQRSGSCMKSNVALIIKPSQQNMTV